MQSSGNDAAALYGFGLGVFSALLGVVTKYSMDYRLSRRRLEIDEQATITSTLGNGLGLLRRSATRLRDRVNGCFRHSQHIASWLRLGPTPKEDSLFLRTFVQRMFVFCSLATVVQSAIDALPPRALKARPDLRQLYALIELAKSSLTDVWLLRDYPGYVVEVEDYHLFIGALDDLADLGVDAYSRFNGTVPVTVFNEYYDSEHPTLMWIRLWLSAAHAQDKKSTAILARLACLEAVLNMVLALSHGAGARFAHNDSLRQTLEEISGRDRNGYVFADTLPSRLDELLSGVLKP